MGTNSGAGAAVASGANYQARVASYILATAICGVESNLLLDGQAATLGFETAESIDDINVFLSNGRLVYIQAKARIDYSLSPDGELRSVLKQFESQESSRSRDGDAFVLTTSSRSSKKVIYDMRAALDAFRLSPEHDFFRDQPKALTEIIVELRRVIGDLQTIAGRSRNLAIADRIIRKSFVAALDVEAGDSLEHSLILLLQSRNFVASTAVWGKLIADCIEHAKARHTLAVGDAELNYKKFRIFGGNITPQASDELMQFKFGSMNFPVGKEVVLCRVPDGMPPFSQGISIMEFYRFNEDCAERICFTEDSVVLSGDRRIPLLRRAATYSGLMRLIDGDRSLIGDAEVTFYPMNKNEDLEVGLCSEIHRERLRKSVLENPHPGRCLHCGRPVSEKEPSLVEQGPLMEPIVGLCHTKCLLPADRLVGRAKMDFFEDYPELVNFDANAWFRASHGGQIAIANASIVVGRTPHLLWSSDNFKWLEKQYVVEISLVGGGREIVTLRNGVHRFSKAEADDFVVRLNQSFNEARSCSDPLCYTDQSKGFGQRSLLLEQLGGKERIIPVEVARVRRYDERFAARYHRPGYWYAPLLYLRYLSTEEPVMVLDTVLLISDPLKLRNFIENWREAKIDVSDYETRSILSDSEFDEFMRLTERNGWRAVINPLLNPANGTMASGIPISSLDAMMEDREGRRSV